jgi:hypothetical protein
MRVVFYLDDILLLADSKHLAVTHCLALKKQLILLGFRLNLKKSEFTPQRRFTYLGLVWDSSEMCVALPSDKKTEIRAAGSTGLSQGHVPIPPEVPGSGEFCLHSRAQGQAHVSPTTEGSPLRSDKHSS